MSSNSQEMPQWHVLDSEKVLGHFQVTRGYGLHSTIVSERLDKDGFNEITEQGSHSILNIVFRQFSDFMILILVAAAIISGIIGAPEDAIAILVIVVLNAIVGASQEYRAEHAIAALKVMAAPEARVLRDGKDITINAREIVVGDLVYLEAGNVVPADLRLLDVENLEIDDELRARVYREHPVPVHIDFRMRIEPHEQSGSPSEANQQ